MKFSVVASMALATSVAAKPAFDVVKPRQGWSGWSWGDYNVDESPSYNAATTTGSSSGSAPTGSSGSSPTGSSGSYPTGSSGSSATSTATATSSASTSRPTGSGSGGGSSSSGSVTDACDIGYCTQNGGTTGGAAGEQTTVTTLEELKTAAGADGAAIIIVSGTITGAEQVDVAADKTIFGEPGSELSGVGLRVKDVSNVILRNLKISKVLADSGDAISIQAADNVWVDHCDLSSDRDHDKDYYDGLCDVTHAANYITISNTYFHDHWKASLVGHSDSNADEDEGNLIVTYANNYWSNVNSRGPSFRFGTGHVFNSYAENLDTGINTRMGAQLLVESCAFSGTESPIESADSETVGYATVSDVDLGSGENTAEAGSLSASDIPYEYTLLGADSVQSEVVANAGQTLTI